MVELYEIPQTVPLLPLRELIVFPPRSIQSLSDGRSRLRRWRLLKPPRNRFCWPPRRMPASRSPARTTSTRLGRLVWWFNS